MNIRSRWGIAACLMLMLVIAAACGRRTNPLIPDSPRPEAIQNIKAATRDAVAFLSWPLPARNIEGKSMDPSSIVKIRIYRAEFGKDRKTARYRPYAEISMADPAPAVVRNNMVSWSDRNLKYDQTYGYRIRALSARGGVSSPSQEVLVTPVIPLAIPRGFVAIGVDSYNTLTWEPVTTQMDGSPAKGFIGYNVYRSAERGLYEDTPVNNAPLTATSYKDQAVANDHTYYYIIRSVDSPAPPWNESPDSEELSATPRDLTPPDKPSGLTVVAGVGRVFLTWNENKERDLAGYHVYRSTRSGHDYIRLTHKVLARTTYSDRTVRSGMTYYYVITAVDRSGNESARSLEKKAMLRN
ncbi:MAG: fibronectin type III domain-containing protein [Betaproteobacteria bacterium]